MDPGVQRAWEAFSSVSTRLSDTKKRAMWRLAVGAPARGNGLTERQMKRAQAEALQPLQVFQEVRPLDRNGQGVPVLCADVRKLLVHACEASSFWREAFLHASTQGDVLTPILYHDEVSAGNILNPEARKKVLAAYLSFTQLRPAISREETWLPLMLVQSVVVAQVEGCLSALVRHVMKAILNNSTQTRFWLALDGRAAAFRLEGPAFFMSDMDAQRATFNNKGSAGILPCLWCSNVIAGEHWRAVPGGVPTHCSDPQLFRVRTDAQLFEAADDLRRPRSARDRAFREKAVGLNFCEESLLADAVARTLLPPSHAAVDSMHAYFEKGVCDGSAAI